MSYLHFFGLDVSKGWFDVAIAGSMSRPRRFANWAEGIAAFAAIAPQGLTFPC